MSCCHGDGAQTAEIHTLGDECKHVIIGRAVVMVTCLPTSSDITSCAEAAGGENTTSERSSSRKYKLIFREMMLMSYTYNIYIYYIYMTYIHVIGLTGERRRPVTTQISIREQITEKSLCSDSRSR